MSAYKAMDSEMRWCNKCKGQTYHRCDLYESSDGAHEDLRLTCEECGNIIWIEGSDY